MSLINDYQKSLEHSQESVVSSVPPLLLHRERKGRIPAYVYVVTALAVVVVAVFVVAQKKAPSMKVQVPSYHEQADSSQENTQVTIVRQQPESKANVPDTPASFVPPASENSSPQKVVKEPKNIASSSRVENVVSHPVVKIKKMVEKEQVSTKLLSAILTELKTINNEPDQHTINDGNIEFLAKIVDKPKKPALTISQTPQLPGNLEVSAKKVEEKKKNLEPIAKVGKQSTKSLNRIYQAAIISYREKRFLEAEAYYLQILERQPEYKNTILNLSALYIDMGKQSKALSLVDRLLVADPNNSKALVNRGNIALKNGNVSLAKTSLEKALDIDPNELSALKNLAYIAGIEANDGSQEEYLARILEIVPDSSELRLSYASMFEKSNRIKEAIKQYEICLESPNIKEDPQMAKQIRKRIKVLAKF